MENENFNTTTVVPPNSQIPQRDYFFGFKIALCLIGIIIGGILIFNIITNDDILLLHFKYLLESAPKAEFGGDFNTYIYRATRIAGNNVSALHDDMELFGFMTGAGFVLGFGLKLFDIIDKHKRIKDFNRYINR